MRIAFLTAQYPKVSHTFIRREIQGLEALEHEVVRLSIHETPIEDLAEPADRVEHERTRAFFATTPATWAGAFVRTAARHPGAVLTEIARAFGALGRPGPSLARRLAYLLQATWALEILAHERVEHLHVHFGRNAACVARIVRRLGGPGFSMVVHGPDEFDDPIGHEIAAKTAEACFTVAISDFTGAQLRRFADPADWGRIERLNCTIDEAFLAAAAPVDPDSRTLVCVGRLCAQKGQLLLLEAFAALGRRGLDARLVLAGDGELRPAVEARITRLGLGDRVEITGWISEAEVRRRILDARALVLPSFAEGLPVVIMEALALGRPVVSTFVAGIPELVRPAENGWLVPAGNAAALEDALADVLARPAAQLDALGRAGAARVRERHLQASEAARLDALLARHVARAPARR